MNICRCGCGKEIAEDKTWSRGHHGRGISREVTEEFRELNRRLKLGTITSEATKEKQRLNCGHSHTEEARKKIGLGNSTKILSKETKEKISSSLKGKNTSPKTEEHKERQRVVMRGREPSPNSGPKKCKWYDYIDRFGHTLRVQGSYELATAQYLDEIEADWAYVNLKKEYSLLLSTGQRTYADFLVNGQLIDVKGYMFEASKPKYDLTEKEYPGSILYFVGDSYLIQLKLWLKK